MRPHRCHPPAHGHSSWTSAGKPISARRQLTLATGMGHRWRHEFHDRR
jgi:hypothetical protein